MKKENTIITLLLLILLLLGYQTYVLRGISSGGPDRSSTVVANAAEKPMLPEKMVNPYANADLKTEVFLNENKTYGYQILLNGSPMIRQPNIPGLPGNAGFRDETKARRTAELVLFKIRKNIMPPAVTTAELDSLAVL